MLPLFYIGKGVMRELMVFKCSSLYVVIYKILYYVNFYEFLVSVTYIHVFLLFLNMSAGFSCDTGDSSIKY